MVIWRDQVILKIPFCIRKLLMKMCKCGNNKSHFWWHFCPCTCIIYLLDFCYQEGTHPVLYGRGKYPPPLPPKKYPLLFPLSKKAQYLFSSYSSVYWICFQLFFVCIVHKFTLDTRAKKILLLLNVSTGWQWRSGFNKWHFNNNYPLTAGTSLNWTLLARLVWHFYQALVIQSSSTRYSYSRIQSIKPI